MTVEELFAMAPAYADRDAARGVDRVTDVVVDGERHQLVVRDGEVSVTKDGPEPAQLTVRMAAEDVFAIVEGRAHPVKLFFAGRIKTEGDLWGARALSKVFRPPPPAEGAPAS